ncbi:site-specific integrase [bacterium]|nr:site-specific integrase [bacterium]
MNSLIQKMQQDMVIQNYSPRTISSYAWHIKAFLNYCRKDVDKITEEDIRTYLYHIKAEMKYSPSNLAQAFSAIKFLYREMLKMPLKLTTLKGPKRGRPLPIVLAESEIKQLFDHIENKKHLILLKTIYSGGLRLNEATHLRVTDIDSKRMTIHVRSGKGNKDRYTILSKVLLLELRDYWKRFRPRTWLFPGKDVNKPIGDSSIQKAFQRARIKAGLGKEATVHTLRHSFATHLLEQGVNLFTIKELMGHKAIKTTLIYLHLKQPSSTIINPLDRLLELDDEPGK